MYLNVNNIVLLILLYQCLASCAHTGVYNGPFEDSVESDCYIPIPTKDDQDHPRPFPSGFRPIRKNILEQTGHMHFKPNELFQLVCGTGKLISIGKNLNKIVAKCISNEHIEYDGLEYEYKDIKCFDDIIISNRTTRLPTDKEDPYKMAVARHKAGVQDCFFILPDPDFNFMPIPFIINNTPAIIHPNQYGFFTIKPKAEFKLTCADSELVSPVTKINEVTVKCISASYIEFKGRQYTFDRFKCRSMPSAKLMMTKDTCQRAGSRVLDVGFETKSAFLVLYKICYDIMRNHPLYAWYHVHSPSYKLRQVSKVKPNYVKTKSFGKLDLDELYWNQDLTLDKIMKSKESANKLIIREEKRYVTRAHLISKSEFYYAFEKHATYFNENTAPQWYRIGKGYWRDVERVFRRYISEDRSKHLVVSGNFMTSTIPDQNNVPHPFYLTVTRQIPVPQYFWKMTYDVIRKEGVVWVGLNNPTTRINETKHICDPIACPARMRRKTYSQKLMYCCNKESFEKVYGKIDPIVYKEFNLIEPRENSV